MRRSPLVAAALAAAVCATAAPAAQAAFPGTNGTILFDRVQPYEDQARTLTVVPGGAPAPLSAGVGGMTPSLSPDGTRLLFSRSVMHGRYGAADVYVANADGSGELPLTDGTGPEHGASWSPDGRRIVFSQKPYGDRLPTELWLMNADGGGKTQLTRAGQHSYNPVFSPDGTKIAFQRYPLDDFDTADLYLYDLNSGGEQQLTNGPGTEAEPDFSPDGTKLAYSVDYAAIATIPVGGGTPTPLVRSTAAAANRSPAFSPDGTRIAFVTYDDDAETAALATAAADGSGVADITPRYWYGEPPSDPSWSVGPAGPPPVVVPVPRPGPDPLPGPAPRPAPPADRAVDGVFVGGDAGAGLTGGRLTIATRVTARSEPVTAAASGVVTIAPARGGRASASAKARGRARRGRARRGRARATTVGLPRATASVAAGGSAVLNQKLGGAALGAVARALRAGRAVTATVTVTVTDASGNVRRSTRRVKITAAPAGRRRAARKKRARAVAAGQALRNNPENKKLPPSANAGYFLGFPSPTYSWHGCTATATRVPLRALQQPIPGEPRAGRGTTPGAVTFTTTVGAPYVSWKVKRGWTICGVQAAALLRNPDVDADLLAEVGYRSGPTSGSTAAAGRETLRVPIPKRAIDRGEFERYEGKVFSIAEIRSVTVFVTRQR